MEDPSTYALNQMIYASSKRNFDQWLNRSLSGFNASAIQKYAMAATAQRKAKALNDKYFS